MVEKSTAGVGVAVKLLFVGLRGAVLGALGRTKGMPCCAARSGTRGGRVDELFNETWWERVDGVDKTLDDVDWVDEADELITIGTWRLDEYALLFRIERMSTEGVDKRGLGSTAKCDLEELFNVVSVMFMTPSLQIACVWHDSTPRFNDSGSSTNDRNESMVLVRAGIGMD